MRRLLLASATVAALLVTVAVPAAAHEPTCAAFEPLGIVVHGQHIVRDYVTDGQLEGWPASGGVGQYVAGEGAAVPGGPGPGFHFPNNFAPGASFCTDSKSPGQHF